MPLSRFAIVGGRAYTDRRGPRGGASLSYARGLRTQSRIEENGEKGKPIERWGRKATGLRLARANYDGWVAAGGGLKLFGVIHRGAFLVLLDIGGQAGRTYICWRLLLRNLV